MLMRKVLLGNGTKEYQNFMYTYTFLRIKGGWPIASIRRIKINLIIFAGIGMFTTKVLLMQFCRKTM